MLHRPLDISEDEKTPSSAAPVERVGLVLRCEGMGDCLYALAVIRSMRRIYTSYRLDLFTYHPELFRACPYVDKVMAFDETALRTYGHRQVLMFEPEKLPHCKVDTFDFISIPLDGGQLTYAEKQIEYFPVESDRAEAFDVVLNTSLTWRTRSWPVENWQRLADALLAKGLRVAVVGKDIVSRGDAMLKRSPSLSGSVCNLANQLSLDQTFYTLCKARLFVSGQGGLTVLAGATDTEIVVLGMSIEWSRRAIYRQGNPFHKVTYVSGRCEVYCGYENECPSPGKDFCCVPDYASVEAVVFSRLNLAR